MAREPANYTKQNKQKTENNTTLSTSKTMLSPRMEISSIYFITGAENIAFRITLPFPNLNDLKCKGSIYLLLKIDVH